MEPGCNQPSELQLCGGKLGVERGADKHRPKRADGEEEAAREEGHLLASCSHGQDGNRCLTKAEGRGVRQRPAFSLPSPAFGEAPVPEQDKHKRATCILGEGRARGGGEWRSHKICPKSSSRHEVEPRASHGAPAVLKMCVLFGRRWPKGTCKTSDFFGSTGTAQRLHHQPRQTILPLKEPLALTLHPP